MSETGELIVKFKSGVDEGAARSLISEAGGTVRRRMRTDGPDEVMLLVRVPGGDVAAMEARVSKHADVAGTERNQGGFTLR